MITEDSLRQFAPRVADAGTYAAALENARQQSTVNTPGRLAHFMGQVFVESGGFTVMVENLNYKNPERLDAIFSAVKGIEDAKALIAKGPEAIANRVYANRLGNGDEASGDGWRYRGSGIIQLTGRANYQRFANIVKMDLVNNPELVRETLTAAQVAFAFWDATGCSPLADAGDLEGITRNVNGLAMQGLAERRDATARAVEISVGTQRVGDVRMMHRTDRWTVAGWCPWAKLALAAACPLLAAAQVPAPVTPPPPDVVVPANAAQPARFVPEGWVLEQQKVADFNGDGRADALLLMRKPAAGGTPQRILAVVLRKPGANAGYALAELNRRLIPFGDDATQEDPMADGELTVRRGGFEIKLTLMAGAGSYQTATLRYRFRYQNGCFRLIGYDRMETQRATLETRDLSIDFLSGAVLHRTGNEQSATGEQRDKLKINPRRCFGELESAAVFNPL